MERSEADMTHRRSAKAAMMKQEKEVEEVEDGEDSGPDDEESFFETFDRVPSSISYDIGADSSSSEAEEDARMSFASAIGDPSEFRRLFSTVQEYTDDEDEDEDDEYTVWMSEPLSIEERRRKLLKEMGLSASSKNGFAAASRRIAPEELPLPQPIENARSPPVQSRLLRSRSYPELLGAERPADLQRASSVPAGGKAAGSAIGRRALSRRVTRREIKGTETEEDPVAFFTIRNLDTGREFVINLENGAWNSRLSDLQTGTQITMEEFEKSMGHSPIVKELLRREHVAKGAADAKSTASGGGGGRKKKGAGWLKKNIRCVANSVTGLVMEKDGGAASLVDRVASRNSVSSSSSSSSVDWMKVHRHGKPYKELTGLYMSQEIQAHEGSIWCMRFSYDAMYMASAGEDRVIHVWQVIECDTVAQSSYPSFRTSSSIKVGQDNAADITNAANGVSCSSPERSGTPRLEVKPSTKLKRGKNLPSGRRKRSSSSIPEHVVLPDTIFSLSEKPVCSFQGHLDDVLDLSWSRSQLLLSSSMDKTVRLWDLETQTCLNLFAHNDYVTCIQFNPVDDRYFISGSLDAKVRIWSIPERQVVDWNDLNEMVTAACYTPDGQGALVGSHKGTCRFYNMTDCKLQQKAQIDIHNKKKKSHAKKITGFQFAPGNPCEVLITSADSQIRIYNGVDLIYKFRGFRNTSSQIAASFTPDGSYVVSASEDSHVYVWKHDEHRGGSGKRNYVSTRSHENFSCKDVSVAVPWPGSIRYERPSAFSSSRFSPNALQAPDHHGSFASITSAHEDPFSSSRSHCPPLPKKSSPDRPLSCTEEELHNPSRSASSIGNTSSSWLWSGPLSSISSGFSMSSSRSGGSHRNANHAVAAWGLVVVAAGLGGEIRVYQNFGLPVRLSKQANLL